MLPEFFTLALKFPYHYPWNLQTLGISISIPGLDTMGPPSYDQLQDGSPLGLHRIARGAGGAQRGHRLAAGDDHQPLAPKNQLRSNRKNE